MGPSVMWVVMAGSAVASTCRGVSSGSPGLSPRGSWRVWLLWSRAVSWFSMWLFLQGFLAAVVTVRGVITFDGFLHQHAVASTENRCAGTRHLSRVFAVLFGGDSDLH